MFWGGVASGAIGAISDWLQRGEDKASESRHRDEARRQNEIQRKREDNYIQRRVADAKRAGIDPLAALGASQSHAPMFFAGRGGGGSNLRNMGQNLSRAAQAAMTRKQRDMADEMTDLDRQGKELNNEYIRSQINLNNKRAEAIGAPPPRPESVETKRQRENILNDLKKQKLIKSVPQEITRHAKGRLDSEPGSSPGLGYVDLGDSLSVVPSKDAKERMEDMMPAEAAWNMRLAHSFTSNKYKPPKSIWKKKWPKAIDVVFDRTKMAWVPSYRIDRGYNKWNWKKHWKLWKRKNIRRLGRDIRYAD